MSQIKENKGMAGLDRKNVRQQANERKIRHRSYYLVPTSADQQSKIKNQHHMPQPQPQPQPQQ
jgi:hypothetical protein